MQAVAYGVKARRLASRHDRRMSAHPAQLALPHREVAFDRKSAGVAAIEQDGDFGDMRLELARIHFDHEGFYSQDLAPRPPAPTIPMRADPKIDEPWLVIGEAPQPSRQDRNAPLFPAEFARKFFARWAALRENFSSDPREGVRQYDRLMADVIDQLHDTLAFERGALESQWHQSGTASTEELRPVVKFFESFFSRLLAPPLAVGEFGTIQASANAGGAMQDNAQRDGRPRRGVG
jgi:hypothetical protein